MFATFACFILKFFDLHFAYGQWTAARGLKYVGGAMTGVWFKVLGDGAEKLSKTRPVVIVCNHQTELDVLMLGTLWPPFTSVTAKKSIKSVPFLGWFMSLSGAVFIDRVDRTQAMKAFEGASKVMNSRKQNVFIFPEGTRSYSTGPTLLPFKKGAFHLAVQAQVDILPVVCENYSKILNVKAKRFNRGSIRIKGMTAVRSKRPRLYAKSSTVLDPISTKGLTAADVDQLTTSTRDKMLQTLNELSQDSDTRSVSPAEGKKTS